MKASASVFLLAVLLLSSFAPLAIASTSGVTARPRLVVNNTESLNWSGYAVTEATFTNVEGSWVVPSVTCPRSGSSYAAFWVGIDGYSSSTVEQTGVLAQCSNGKASYSAWYEFYPAASVTISDFAVAAGQTISAEVSYASGKFTVSLTDSSGAKFSTTGTVSGAKMSSAEWVVERPELCSRTCTLTTLANFGTATFSGSMATGGQTTGSISAFTNVPINMVSSSGATLDQTGSLSSSGTSFTVTYG